MNLTEIDAMAAHVPLPPGYRSELLKRADIPDVVASIKAWFPDISVGGASCYLREQFFCDKVCFADQPEKDVIVVLIRKGAELAGLFSCEREQDAQTLYARLAVISPRHRGMNLGHATLGMAEALGRQMGVGFIYGLATLKIPHMQKAFEKFGWQLVGIMPGYDREMVTPGVVKRVYEAVYGKLLIADAGLLAPQPANMTRRTRAFFELLFPDASGL